MTEKNHCIRKQWPPRKNFILGTNNISQKPLVNPQCVFLSPLHIKLRMKILVKALDRGVVFLHLKKFKILIEAKVKEGGFIGPQIKAFENKLSEEEEAV